MSAPIQPSQQDLSISTIATHKSPQPTLHHPSPPHTTPTHPLISPTTCSPAAFCLRVSCSPSRRRPRNFNWASSLRRRLHTTTGA